LKDLRIIVVDDSPIIRDYLETTFNRTEGCTVVGMAADGIEAVKIIRELRPQVVVLDITMPHRNGIEVLREIRKEDSDMVIIMFTADPSVVLEEICLKEGANHYLNKSEVLDLMAICKELVRGRGVCCSVGSSARETF
jgi:two-component system, CitB family, response regulator DctR